MTKQRPDLRIAAALGIAGLALVLAPPAGARPSDPGVVNYAVLGKGSVGNIVGAPVTFEAVLTNPVQVFSVDLPVCNNWADIGLPEVFNDPDLASFNGSITQTSPNDVTHLVKQAVGVFADNEAATAAYHRVTDRTVGCSGQTAVMGFGNGTSQVWTFAGAPPGPADAVWMKQEAGTDRRCFTQTRLRENVLLQAKVCQSGNGGPAVNVLAGAMQNSLGQ
ncbi:MAG: sensor domain-containing protein [Mycobacterium sp.]